MGNRRHLMTDDHDEASELTVDNIFHALAGWPEVEKALSEWHERHERGSRTINGDLPEDLLLRGIRHPEGAFREIAALAGHWSCDVMALAIRDGWATVRAIAAGSSRTPADGLATAATDASVDVRLAVAANPSTPVTALQGLLRDSEISVVHAAVLQKRLPCRIMSRLATSDDPVIMEAVAGAPQTSTAALHRLASRTTSTAVWTALVNNPHTERRTLELVPVTRHPHLHLSLVKHPWASDALCRRIAALYLDEPDAPLRLAGLTMLFRGSVTVAAWGTGRTHPKAPTFRRPSDVLAWLADGADLSTVLPYALDPANPGWLRWFILSRAQLDQATCDGLADDPEPRIRRLSPSQA